MDLLQVFLSLIGVLALIFLLFFGLKKLGRNVAVVSGNKMRVLDRVNLGRESMLLVVCVCGRLMVIGATGQRIDKICDLDMTEEEYLGNGTSLGSAKAGNFSAVLSGIIGKRNGKEEGRDFDVNSGDEQEKPSDGGENDDKIQ